MRIKIIERCIRICNQVIINPKFKHDLRYVLEALEQEIRKSKLRQLGKEVNKKSK